MERRYNYTDTSSMVEITPEYEAIAHAFAAPLILRILKPFSAEQLSNAIRGHMNLVTWLKETPEALRQLKMILTYVPFYTEGVPKALPNIRSKPWLRWFINNELVHKRPDLYVIFMYNPKALSWLYRNMYHLSKFLIVQLSLEA